MKTIGTLLCLLGMAAGLAAAESDPLTMEAAVRQALSRNERALAADESGRAAAARVQQARAFFFPGIDVSSTYTRRPYSISRTVGDTSVTVQRLNALTTYVDASLPLFDPDAIPALRRARFENRAQQAGTAETRRQLAFEVCTAFLTTLGNNRVVEAARHRHELAVQNLEAARARFQAGLVSTNDVTRNELEAASAESALISARGQAQTARLHLGYLLNLDLPDRTLQEPETMLGEALAPPPASEALAPAALNLRADISQLRWQYRAQRALALQPQLNWLPTIGLFGQYKKTNESGLSGKTSTWSMGLELTWTIFDGFARDSLFRERKALARIAALDTAAAERNVGVQMEEALANLTTQQAALRQADVALEVARRNADENRELYRQGLTGALQVADAVVSLYEAEVAHVQARHGLMLSFLNLRLVQGLDPFGKETFHDR
jgi:outer membrane protein TolC